MPIDSTVYTVSRVPQYGRMNGSRLGNAPCLHFFCLYSTHCIATCTDSTAFSIRCVLTARSAAPARRGGLRRHPRPSPPLLRLFALHVLELVHASVLGSLIRAREDSSSVSL
eukprot:COSAG02_NODE_6124_length_3784_cov_1.813297_2_plen_112_part_00